jgi:hypothetical protein
MRKGRKKAKKRGKCPKKPLVKSFLGVSGLKFRLGIADAISSFMTSITKTATPEVSVGLFTFFASLAAKVRAAIEAQAPIGYQDETGFHTGVKPRDEDASGMAAW